MAPRFIGIDPDTGSTNSPTVWVDEDRQEIVLQGWVADAELEAFCAAEVLPGHALGIPEGEAVIRIPARMASIVREACDVAERS